VADFLTFDQLPVNIYELPPWLADEVREVVRIYHANKEKEA
jgi:hypothetical protein